MMVCKVGFFYYIKMNKTFKCPILSSGPEKCNICRPVSCEAISILTNIPCPILNKQPTYNMHVDRNNQVLIHLASYVRSIILIFHERILILTKSLVNIFFNESLFYLHSYIACWHTKVAWLFDL